MMNCQRATRLMSEARDRRLSLAEKTGLRVHLLMCKGCRHFDSQMDSLRDFMREYSHTPETRDTVTTAKKPLDDRSSAGE
mgnify:CR=1 FL=1